MKYGLIINNILGLEVVLINGEIVKIGGKYLDVVGYDFFGVMVGFEGLFGVVIEVMVWILCKFEMVWVVFIGFELVEDVGDCVVDIIVGGIIFVGMEMMDCFVIYVVEDFVGVGYFWDVEVLFIVEFDGLVVEVDDLCIKIIEIVEVWGVMFICVSESEEEWLVFWVGWKVVFFVVGRILLDYYCMDGMIFCV